MSNIATREQMALEALNLLLDLNDHRDVCIALQQGRLNFCDWEKAASKRYSELIRRIYGGKNKRIPQDGITSGECPTNGWFPESKLHQKVINKLDNGRS